VVEVLGGTATEGTVAADDVRARGAVLEPVECHQQRGNPVDRDAGFGRSILHPRRDCLAIAPAHDDAARLTAAFTPETVTAVRGRTPQIGPTQGDRPGSSDPPLVLPTADQRQPVPGESVHPTVHRTGVITP
jgi:hypothetical protein